jgi:hypothetical protein
VGLGLLDSSVTIPMFIFKSLLMKIFTVWAFALSIVFVGSSAFAFSDVDDSYRYSEAVDLVSSRGIMNGYDGGIFLPEKILNRAELLKVIIEAKFDEDEFAGYGGNKCFNDINPNSWYATYVCFAKDQKIVTGYDGNLFKPTQEILFVEALKIAMDVFEHYDFPDDGVTTQDPWYANIVYAASASAFIPPDIDSFKEYSTRGQMAELIYRILDLEDNGINYDNYESRVTYEMIEHGDDSEEAVWGMRSLTNINSVYQFILNSDEDDPYFLRSSIYEDWYQQYYLFYYHGDHDEDLAWGTTNIETIEGVVDFLNYGNYSDADVIYDTHDSPGRFFVFFRDKDGDANWDYQTLDNTLDMLYFVNGEEGYDEPHFGPIVEISEDEYVIFYRTDIEHEGGFSNYSFMVVNNWSRNVYHLLNGFGDNNWGPVTEAEFIGENMLFYKKP